MTILDADYLTVAEAATTLKVSTATIWRWVNDGRLPAYRVGPRKVRLKAADIHALITPARQIVGGRDSSFEYNADVEKERERLSQPLTKEQKRRGLAALAAVERRERESPLPEAQRLLNSWELLNESRDERSRPQS